MGGSRAGIYKPMEKLLERTPGAPPAAAPSNSGSAAALLALGISLIILGPQHSPREQEEGDVTEQGKEAVCPSSL